MALFLAMAVLSSRHRVLVLPTCTAFRSSSSRVGRSNGNGLGSPSLTRAVSITSNRHSSSGTAFVRGTARLPSTGTALYLPSAAIATTTTSLAGAADDDNDDMNGGTADKKKKRAAKKKSKTTKERSTTKNGGGSGGSATKEVAFAEPSSYDDAPAAAVPGLPGAAAITMKQDGATPAGAPDADAPPPAEAGPIVMPASQLAAAQKEAEQRIKAAKAAAILANTSPEGLYYGPRPRAPDILQFDVTGGRPGAVIESEDELKRKARMMEELGSGKRRYEEPWFDDYGYLEQEADAKYTTDDPDAIDADTLGQYDITDLNTKFDWEWNPETDSDPNVIPTSEGRFITETEKDEEGVEKGYDPYFGPSNPIDERTMIGTAESYMIDVRTRDEKMLTPQFHPGDPEIDFNEEVIQYRKSMDIIESYVDSFLPAEVPVPRNVAKWYGYPEPMRYPPKNFTNNRYTQPEDLTNFDELTPYRARQKAVELARAKNAEWLPVGVSHAWHGEQRRPYEEYATLVGTLRPGKVDEEILEIIQPALKVLGSCAILLSMEGEGNTVFRFHYHGLMKNRAGMEAWTETLIRDCGVEVTGVVFETGFRARDPAYDGGDPYHGWN